MASHRTSSRPVGYNNEKLVLEGGELISEKNIIFPVFHRFPGLFSR